MSVKPRIKRLNKIATAVSAKKSKETLMTYSPRVNKDLWRWYLESQCIAAYNFDKNLSRTDAPIFIYKLAVGLYFYGVTY